VRHIYKTDVQLPAQMLHFIYIFQQL